MSNALTLEQQADVLLSLFPPLRLRNCSARPTPMQEAFLRLDAGEVLLGGGAGGGKSIAMLMGALQYTDVPGYNALLLRTSLAELELAGALIERSRVLLANSKAHWSGETRTWTFPAPGAPEPEERRSPSATSPTPAMSARYAGTSYQFVGFDELTRFEEIDYLSIRRVLRTPSGALPPAPDGTRLQDVPERIRATSNPGGRGHEWVKRRFVDPATRPDGVVYLHSLLTDNPHIPAAYSARLEGLPTALRARLLEGNWDMPDDGELFRRGWFTLVEPHQIPVEDIVAVRCWDLAATEPSAAPTATPTGPSGSNSSGIAPAASSTSPTSSANAKARARSKARRRHRGA